MGGVDHPVEGSTTTFGSVYPELEAKKAAQVAIKVRLAKVKYCVSSGYKCNVLWRLVWCRHERNVNVM